MGWLALTVMFELLILLVPSDYPRPRAGADFRIEEWDYPPDRWILSLKRGSSLLGSRERQRLRARVRRRRVFATLLEAIGLTGLIGVFPPTRGMLVVTVILTCLLGLYAFLLLRLRAARRRRIDQIRHDSEAVPRTHTLAVVGQRPGRDDRTAQAAG